MTDRSMNIQKDGIKFLDSNCLFKDCKKSSGEGGAINFRCTSAIIQRRFCCIGCSTNNAHGAHSYCYFSAQSSLPNLVIESSVSQCKGGIRSCFLLHEGNTGVHSTNCSNNEVYTGSGFETHSPNQEFICNYSSFCNNQQSNSFVIYHGQGTFKEFMCNFVNNPWSGNTWFMIHLASGPSLSVDSCTIIGPYGSNSIFGVGSSGTITVTNCDIDNINKIGAVTTKNIRTNQITNKLSHYSTMNCEAVNPLADYEFIELSIPAFLKRLYFALQFCNPLLDL